MAPGGFRLYRSPRQKLLPIDHIEDELAGDPGPTGNSHPDNTSSVLSYNSTLVLALVSTLIPALVLFPVLTLGSFDKLFRQFIKAYLEFQGLSQPLVERKQFFNAKVPNMCYRRLHIDCYHFCQQCKDHFEIAGATGANRTLFVASFLCESIRNNFYIFYDVYHISFDTTLFLTHSLYTLLSYEMTTSTC